MTADADGRFAIHDFGNPGIQDPPPVAGSTLVLTRSIGSSGIPDDGLTQACAAAVRIDGDMELNVELVPWRSRELTRGSSSPSLSGMVYEVTPDGRRPVADAWIAYDVLCMLLDPDNGGNLLEISEAAQRTDADGRYELCRLPVGGPSWIQNACVHVRKDGLHSVQTQRVTLQGSNTVLDIELHRNQH